MDCCLLCTAAVRRRHPACTEQELQQRMSKYLAEAGDREGNRKVRQPKATTSHDVDDSMYSDMEC